MMPLIVLILIFERKMRERETVDREGQYDYNFLLSCDASMKFNKYILHGADSFIQSI